MRRSAASSIVALALAIGLLPPPGGVPVAPDATRPPRLTAEAWILVDVDSGVVLAESNADEIRPMASVTKIMTAMVVVDHVALDDRVRISPEAAAVGESEIGLVTGEVWTVDALLNALLIRSGNDAAVALAEHVAGSIPAFADLMNEKATALGLENTSFRNPHGLDEEGHHTTARELSEIAMAALDYPELRKIMATRLISFRPDPSGIARDAENTNKLLGVYPGVTGMKTGYTGKAGRVLVSLHERNGRTLIGVVMGSDDHFDDSRRLLDWGHHLITVRDQLNVPLVARQGGGGTSASIGARASARARATSELPSGKEAVSDFRTSDLAHRIETWLREVMPASVGGA